MGDAMTALENRAMGSKRNMDIFADLEETRSIRSRHDRVSTDRMLEILNHSSSTAHHQNLNLNEENTVLLAEEDEQLVRSITFLNSEGYVKRIKEEDDDEEYFGSEIINEFSGFSALNHPTDVLAKANGPETRGANKQGNKILASKVPKFIVKPKPAAANPQKKYKTGSAAAVQDIMAKLQRRKLNPQKRRPMFFIPTDDAAPPSSQAMDAAAPPCSDTPGGITGEQ
ncbi:coiled-coil domain-containing protein 94 [Hordeum vulgare]|nr:coiled-coil domain-containing protein 94 [Hordeum vulgare]